MNRVSMIKFHWINNLGDAITHYIHDLDTDLYLKLKNLYCVSIIQTDNNAKKVIGGFFIKTDKEYTDSDFIELLIDTLKSIDLFKNLSTDDLSFKPSKITVDERNHPLSEIDFLKIIVEQRLKIY